VEEGDVMAATEVVTEAEATAEQRVHAQLHGIEDEELEEMAKYEPQNDDGGEVCGICGVRGCRIGPMVRG
jgi:hypothetical protein